MGRRRRNDDSGEVLLQEVDESVGGRVVGADVGVVLQLGLDPLGQLLPQLDTVTSTQTGSERHKHTSCLRLNI